jgi:hypothetical protein
MLGFFPAVNTYKKPASCGEKKTVMRTINLVDADEFFLFFAVPSKKRHLEDVNCVLIEKGAMFPADMLNKTGTGAQ